MRGHGHNRARAVLHQDKIPNPNRNLLVVKGIHGVASGEEPFFLHGRQVFGFYGGLPHLGEPRFGFCGRGGAFEQLRSQRMRGRKNHRRCAVNRVDAGGENLDWASTCGAGHGKLHLCALRFANPIFLHQDDALGPSAFELFQIIEQLVGIGGRPQKPLLDLARFHARIFMPPAEAAVDHLFVRQHRLAFWTPVHQAFLAIGQAALEHPQEKPLVPAVVSRLAGGNFAPPVVAEAEAA